jgi:hypothetical protein
MMIAVRGERFDRPGSTRTALRFCPAASIT